MTDFPQGPLAGSELQYAMWSPTNSALVRIMIEMILETVARTNAAFLRYR